MNVTELARKLKITPNKLREVMPQLGFDIGVRAIKVDSKMARDILEKLSNSKIREEYLDEKPKASRDEKVFIDKDQKEEKEFKVIKIPQKIVVKELARRMEVPVTNLVMELMRNGVMASLNQDIDFETASIITEDMGFKVELSEEKVGEDKDDKLQKILEESKKGGSARPPVVVVMGHVDHGKTKLLDAVRETNIVDGEAGGITQHIGAYQAKKDDRLLTFIDTPGHEAFSAMRSRGAQVADIAILVVAADDGVQPQTIEAVSHIRQAGLPFIVAINKIDKPDANIDKIKTELANIDLNPEDWGGKTICVEISAKDKTNIPELLDTLFLVADLHKEDIVAKADERAVGTIIESHVDKGEGPVATVLVQSGTLRVRDYVQVGKLVSKVRMMKDWKGEAVREALPSTPVRLVGLKSVPQVGDMLEAFDDKKKIKQAVRMGVKDYGGRATKVVYNLEQGDDEDKEDKPKMSIILKADVLGSVEAIEESLEKITEGDVDVAIVKQGLGNITEKDVEQAKSQGSFLIGFNVKVSSEASKLAVARGVEIKLYSIIYELLDFVKEERDKLIGRKTIQVLVGKLKVLEVFRTEKDAQIIGGEVIHGQAINDVVCRLMRKEEILGEAQVTALEAGKEKVKEVAEGQQCGVKIEGKNRVEKGDVIEFYKEEESRS